MPTVTVRHRKWVPRSIRRNPGMPFHPLVGPDTVSIQTPGDIFASLTAFPDHPDIDTNLPLRFAFWSVLGAGAFPGEVQSPGYTGDYTTTTNPCPPIPVGNDPIIATAWYIVDDANAQGLQIDAFDVDLGDFVNDDFVKVTPHEALSAGANQNGFVPTISTEHVLAFAQIHAVPFHRWQVFYCNPAGAIIPAGPVSDDLTATEGSSGIAFAFYRTPKPELIIPAIERELGVWVSRGVTIDGGGPTGGGPVDPWNPLLRQLVAGLALAQIANRVAPELRTKVLELATKQVSAASDAITKGLDAERKRGRTPDT